MLMAFPQGMANEDQMRLQMEQSLQQQGSNRNLRETANEQRTYTIRGEETNVTIAKSEDDNGQGFRQATGFFTSKDGAPAMFMVVMSEEMWSTAGEAEFETLIQSMQ